MASVRVPVVVKQKFGPLARILFVQTATGRPVQEIRGHAELDGSVNVSWATVTALSGRHATIELRSDRLEDLAKLGGLSFFELASPMS